MAKAKGKHFKKHMGPSQRKREANNAAELNQTIAEQETQLSKLKRTVQTLESTAEMQQHLAGLRQRESEALQQQLLTANGRVEALEQQLVAANAQNQHNQTQLSAAAAGKAAHHQQLQEETSRLLEENKNMKSQRVQKHQEAMV